MAEFTSMLPGGNRPIGNPVMFNPAQVMLQQKAPTQPTQKPYIGTPFAPSESVRATGNGPFDATYRQNLATYSGGKFQRPGGNLSFNPTGQIGGQPTGYGTAPVSGLPQGLLESALGGQPFSFTPQASPQASAQAQPNYWKFWLNQYNSPFNNMRPARSSY